MNVEELNHKGVRLRNDEAVEAAVARLAMFITQLSDIEIKQIECIPPYIIEAIRIANYRKLQALVRRVAKCFSIKHAQNQSFIDQKLAKEFCFQSYLSFYYNESPGMVNHKFKKVRQDGVGIRIDLDEVERLNIKDYCRNLIAVVRIEDEVAAVFKAGGRVKSVFQLSEFFGSDNDTYYLGTYNKIRRDWSLYSCQRSRGVIYGKIDTESEQRFANEFDLSYDQGNSPYRAALEAFVKVELDINVPRYTLDAYVNSLVATLKERDRDSNNH
ncbi:TPA: hypothetical protein I7682_17925 [Vibrio vulnificus]|nr:hypothetical protein [Vibrio vulnificus]